MAKVELSKELSVKVGDSIGAGAALFGKLKEADINVAASCCYQIGPEAYFSFVPDDIGRAEEVLREAKLEPEQQNVLLVELSNEAGAFAEVLKKISDLGIGVQSAYVTTTAKKVAMAVLKTEDDARVAEELDKGD
jgi:hypothetical protein